MNTIFTQPKNTLPQIDHVYLFVSVDAVDGNEGVCAAPAPGVGCMPLIAADEKRLEQLIPMAKQIALLGNVKIRLIKLSKREVIETYEP